MTDERANFLQLLEVAHTALRMVDASDPEAPQTAETFQTVSDAVLAIEACARLHGVRDMDAPWGID